MQITPILLLLAAGFLQLFQSIFWLLMNSLQPEMDWKLMHVIGTVVPNGLIVLLAFIALVVSVIALVRRRYSSQGLGFAVTALSTTVFVSHAVFSVIAIMSLIR
ncbi:hypothetical protein [Synechococcus sp. UW105]|nr:hypothetical protein [Synechococcus sp. UW105]RZO12957.1 MAG: hypothetical protein EVB08_06865 [Synechococcus sp. MED-G135]